MSCLAALEGAGTRLRIPVFTLSSVVEDRLFGEDAGTSWPVEIVGFSREIEVTLGEGAESGPGIVANPVGGATAL